MKLPYFETSHSNGIDFRTILFNHCSYYKPRTINITSDIQNGFEIRNQSQDPIKQFMEFSKGLDVLMSDVSDAFHIHLWILLNGAFFTLINRFFVFRIWHKIVFGCGRKISLSFRANFSTFHSLILLTYELLPTFKCYTRNSFRIFTI